MNKIRQHYILILLLLFLLSNNIIWYQLGGRPLHWDSSVHLTESLNANHVGENSNQSLFKEYLNVSWYYPPFVSYVSVPFYKIFGESKGTAFFVMDFFLLIFITSVYAIALRLFNKKTANLSALLISMCPIVIHFSRDFMLDLPLAAIVSLSIYLLFTSYEFRSSRNSILLGISFGIGILTRWTFIFFLIVPFVYSFIKAIKKSSTRRKQIINVFLSILVGIILSGPWYMFHLVQFVSRLGEFKRGSRNLFENAFYYIGIIPSQVSWLITIILLIGLIWYVKNKFTTNGLLNAWFIGSYIIISLISFKEPRFSISLLPPLIIIASSGLLEWINFISKRMNGKTFAFQSIISLIIVQFLIISYIPASTKIGNLLSTKIFSSSIIPVDGPNDSDWKQLKILTTINKEIKQREKTKVVLSVIPDIIYFNRQSFEYVSKLEKFHIQMFGTTGFPFLSNYVVLKTGNLGKDSIQRALISKRVFKNSMQSNSLYTRIKNYPLPDGTDAVLFRINPPVDKNASNELILQKFKEHTINFFKRYIHPIKDFSLSVSEYDSNETVRGHIKSISFRTKEADLGDFDFKNIGLRVRNINLKLTEVGFNPFLLIEKDNLQLLSLSGVHFNSMSITANDLKEYIETSSNNKTIVKNLSINNGVINLDMEIPKSKLNIISRIKLWVIKNKNIEFEVEELKINSIPIYPSIINVLTQSYNPILKGFDFLSDFKVGNLFLTNNQIIIKN